MVKKYVDIVLDTIASLCASFAIMMWMFIIVIFLVVDTLRGGMDCGIANFVAVLGVFSTVYTSFGFPGFFEKILKYGNNLWEKVTICCCFAIIVIFIVMLICVVIENVFNKYNIGIANIIGILTILFSLYNYKKHQ